MMTALTSTAPRVAAFAGQAGPEVLDSLTAALRMLHDAQRIRLVDRPDGADIVHTIGVADLPPAARSGPRRVHTVDRIELRAGRVAPAGWWLRRERRYVPDGTIVLAHGRTAGQMLVEAGLVSDQSVLCLPLVRRRDGGGFSPRARARTRALLGLPPGTRLVLGTAPAASRRSARGWAHELGRLTGPAVIAGHLSPDPAGGDRWQARLTDGTELGTPLPCEHLLAAADLFVAAACTLDAHCLGLEAVATGLPLVSVTTDASAESVLATGNGLVVRPHAASIARAVARQLDAGLPTRHTAPDPGPTARVAEVARGVLGAYRRALDIPVRTSAGAPS